MNGSSIPAPQDLVASRVFEASVERVWAAWTDGAQVMRWWGPDCFTCPVARMDVREGGSSIVAMRPPQGPDIYNSWSYRRIRPLQQLEFVLDWADAEGRPADPTAMGLPPEIPRHVRHVVTFRAVGPDRTEMIVTEYGYTSEMFFDLSKAGLEQCLDKMAASFR